MNSDIDNILILHACDMNITWIIDAVMDIIWKIHTEKTILTQH